MDLVVKDSHNNKYNQDLINLIKEECKASSIKGKESMVECFNIKVWDKEEYKMLLTQECKN